MTIHLQCPSCKKTSELLYQKGEDTKCPNCGTILVRFLTEEFEVSHRLNQCPVCGASHLYRQKDFNRRVGILLLVLGLALAYFTYGVSVGVLTLFDWWLYRKWERSVAATGVRASFEVKK